MSALLVALAVWSFDRVEPPGRAVLVGPAGQERVVELSHLPAQARPGDRLATPTGPIVGVRRAHLMSLRAQLRRLCRLATPLPVGQRRAMAVQVQSSGAQRPSPRRRPAP